MKLRFMRNRKIHNGEAYFDKTGRPVIKLPYLSTKKGDIRYIDYRPLVKPLEGFPKFYEDEETIRVEYSPYGGMTLVIETDIETIADISCIYKEEYFVMLNGDEETLYIGYKKSDFEKVKFIPTGRRGEEQ